MSRGLTELLRLIGKLVPLVFAVFSLLGVTQAAPLFESPETIEAELVGPLEALLDERHREQALPFVLRSGGEEFDVKVSPRGKSRLRLCKIPLLHLEFVQAPGGDTVFADLTKVKLTLPCRKAASAEEDLLEEFAAYRIFNMLTPASYRVRLLRLALSDAKKDQVQPSLRLHSFFIEPDEQLAARVNGVVSGRGEIALGWLDQEQLATVYVFQYLIGNTDWSLVSPYEERICCHNGTLIETGNGILYIPFDFDLSGLVHAPYARPDEDLRIRSVRQRLYRGFCMQSEYLEAALDRLWMIRDDVAELMTVLPTRDTESRRKNITYLDQAFRAAAQDSRLLARFERDCLH